MRATCRLGRCAWSASPTSSPTWPAPPLRSAAGPGGPAGSAALRADPGPRQRRPPAGSGGRGLGRWEAAEADLGELVVGDLGGGAGERVGAGLGLGEGDHLADRVDPGEQRHDPVEPEGEATVRRRAIFEAPQEEPEPLLRLRTADPQLLEDLALHVRPVDTA